MFKLNTKVIMWTVLVFFLLIHGCQRIQVNEHGTDPVQAYPQTGIVNYEGYGSILHVSASGSDANGNGSKDHPFRSVKCALDRIPDASVGNRVAVLVGSGEYSEQTLYLKKYVDLYGGFDGQSWNRDIYRYRSTLSGNDERRILVAADSSGIDGFFITEGRVKGNGAAILCMGTSPLVSNNVFVNNITIGPDNWNPTYMHETAHDGGAVYGAAGSAPVIRNNLFVHNKTENGRGGAVAFDGKCKPVIMHNVFIYNTTGLKDPMRSSDGGAVSIFNWCDATIRENVFLGNKADSKNDGGALFIALWSSAQVTGNCFVDNQAGDDAGALFVGGQEHRYDTPLDPVPPADRFFVSISENMFMGNNNPSRNSGAMRLTMETRGEFRKNIVTFNNGIYFQRSEALISENVILDDVLIIETKEGLKVSTVENNLIWADLRTDDVPVSFSGNMIRSMDGIEEKSIKPPTFLNDEVILQAAGAVYQSGTFQTRVPVFGRPLAPGSLTNRIVRSGGKWSVIKSNTETEVVLWGDMSSCATVRVMPTYTLSKNK